MPGIAMDGSEDLPSYTGHSHGSGICPWCFESASHEAKDFDRTQFCKNGHKWAWCRGCLAIPSNARRTEPIDPNDTVYGLCPKCGCAGVIRARDLEGTTWCANNHEWKNHPIESYSGVALEQNTQYSLSPEAKDILKSLLTELEGVRTQINQIEDSVKRWLP